jgi:hypothetical protein
VTLHQPEDSYAGVVAKLGTDAARRKGLEFWDGFAALLMNLGIAGLVPTVTVGAVVIPAVGQPVETGILLAVISVFAAMGSIGFVVRYVSTKALAGIESRRTALETEKEQLVELRSRHLEELDKEVLAPIQAALEQAVDFGGHPFTWRETSLTGTYREGAALWDIQNQLDQMRYFFRPTGEDFKALDSRPEDHLWQDAPAHFPELSRLSSIADLSKELREASSEWVSVLPLRILKEGGSKDVTHAELRKLKDLDADRLTLGQRALTIYLSRRTTLRFDPMEDNPASADFLRKYVEALPCRPDIDALITTIQELSKEISKEAASLLLVVRAYRAYHRLEEDCPFTYRSGLRGLIKELE